MNQHVTAQWQRSPYANCFMYLKISKKAILTYVFFILENTLWKQ